MIDRISPKMDVLRKVRRLCLDDPLHIQDSDYGRLIQAYVARYGMPAITQIATIERSYRKVRLENNSSNRDDLGIQSNIEVFAR